VVALKCLIALLAIPCFARFAPREALLQRLRSEQQKSRTQEVRLFCFAWSL